MSSSNKRLELALSRLDSSQKAAVVSPLKILQIIAGAGSGKTTVLTTRVAYRANESLIDPSRSLLITFTRKAANEMSARLGSLMNEKVSVGTFHGIAYKELIRHSAERSLPKPIVADGLGILRSCSLGGYKAFQIHSHIAAAKNLNISAEKYASSNPGLKMSPEKFVSIFKEYEEKKRRSGIKDFDDLISELLIVLQSDRAFSESVRMRYAHVFVDEFQDLTRSQFRLLLQIVGDEPDLCVVGDANQSIYGWNGSDPSMTIDFQTFFPESEKIVLGNNYRSTSAIKTIADGLLQHGLQNSMSVSPLEANSANERSGYEPIPGVMPAITSYEDEQSEAFAVAQSIKQLIAEGASQSKIAVLTRTNSSCEPIGHCLELEGIRATRAASWIRSDRVAAVLSEMKRDANAQLSCYSKIAIDNYDGSTFDYEELQRTIAEYLVENRTALVGEYLEWIQADARFDGPQKTDGVSIMSIHKSKGLEFDHVFICGLTDDKFPLGGDKCNDVDEELRLFYVAMTRAARALYISWPRTVLNGSRSVARKRSRWIPIIEREISKMTNERKIDLSLSAKQVTSIKEKFVKPHESDLMQLLLRWRKKRSRFLMVPEQQVMSDFNLNRLASKINTGEIETSELTRLGLTKLIEDFLAETESTAQPAQ